MSQQLSFFDQPRPAPAIAVPFGRSLIYEPKGRAREYAALACNVYRGCDHGCVYCYAPDATQQSREQFAVSSLRRGDFLNNLSREAAAAQAAGVTHRILLSFTCDPYQHLDEQEGITRRVIQSMRDHGLCAQVLTKGGSRAMRDLDLFTPHDAFASTLTFLDDARSQEWEPHAALPGDRLATLREFHQAGIPTWVSLEPVLDPDTALEIIRATSTFVDVFKVGKLNHHPLEARIDWRDFGRSAITLLTSLGYRRSTDPDAVNSGRPGEKTFYVKKDLALYL